MDGYPRIKQIRQQNHLSQEQMAEILHISRRTYSTYENGTVSMPVDILVRIAVRFESILGREIGLDELVGREKRKIDKTF
ncbi:MAG: helix-turn-helix domain-containing protein [Eubacterium sp.]|nr:helix-turn-helix domain-containing protein [Eubacterium sp.]